MASKVSAYIGAQKAKFENNESLAEIWHNLEDFYSRKLWHQLTEKLLKSMKDKEFVKHMDLQEFYTCFVSEFEHRISFTALLKLVQPIGDSYDPLKAVAFYDKILEMVKHEDEPSVLCIVGKAEAHLRNKDAKGSCLEIKKVRELVEEAQKRIDDLDGVTYAHAEFYRISSKYFCEIGDFSSYYKEALRYLGCIDVNTLTLEEQESQALYLSLAALLGEDVYNFGELLAHPIIGTLDSSKQHAWLAKLVRAFNAGDLKTFKELETRWKEMLDLRNHEIDLKRKIKLLSLMEMAYIRPANKRVIRFEEIAQRTELSTSEVEFLVMKALSLGLVKGYIDEVDQTVSITWVQPRVLDKTQIGHMSARIFSWCTDVKNMYELTREESKEIVTLSS